MKPNRKLLQKLTTKFEQEYCNKRDDFNEECIRADVIIALKEDLGKKLPQHIVNKLMNMETSDESIKFLTILHNTYYEQTKNKWLWNLLIELQKQSIYLLKKLKSAGHDPYKVLASLLSRNMQINSITNHKK